MNARRVGLVVALAAEARALGAPRGPGPCTLSDGTLLAVSGMGPAAAASARSLLAAGAGALACCGLAGALAPGLRTGAILLPAEVISSTGAVLPTDEHWRTHAARALAALEPHAAGRLLTSERALGTPADKSAAHERTGALAVDMESAFVAEEARQRGCAFLCARVILDEADDAVPPVLLAAADRGGAVRPLRLITALLRSPGELASVLHLARRYRRAQASLRALGRADLPAAAPPAVAPPGVAP